ncbi:Uncharacterised protein [Mycobacteroides abscessus subsp. abscessus]|nr:Uncharacterised protein [Mycobacteroides abscessus subsp. abscessus]SKW28491.1 Uncharacterised protein [Mycobacteroides abscessus subsp. abscessus]
MATSMFWPPRSGTGFSPGPLPTTMVMLLVTAEY